MNPYHVAGNYNLAVTFLSSGDLDKAIVFFTNSVIIDPRLAEGYAGRAEAYMRKGETDKAIADLKSAVMHDPNSTSAKLLEELKKVTGKD